MGFVMGEMRLCKESMCYPFIICMVELNDATGPAKVKVVCETAHATVSDEEGDELGVKGNTYG